MAIRILFQGDSITDAGHSRGGDQSLGEGYPLLVAARLGRDHGERYQVLNRGISGNRVVDLYARWKIDCLNLRPDVISILIGVNDVWHEVARENGVAAPKYELIYTMLLHETREALPNAAIIVMEPFVLEGSATQERWAYFRDEVALRRAAARRAARHAGVVFLPLQDALDAACALAPAGHWLADGVHPTPAGHQLLADLWIQTLQSIS